MEKRESKDQHEVDAIESVYDKSKFIAYGIEQPDFKLIRKEDFYTIGAEVIRLFFNDSTARLKNIPTYSEEILRTGTFRHRDEKNLKIDSIILPSRTDASGKPLELPAVLYVHPAPQVFLTILRDRILKKENKYSKFSHSYKKLELIIKDEEGYFGDKTIYELSNTIFKDSLLNNSIQFSCFNEIYLLGRIFDKEQFIPLKKALFGYRAALVSEFYGKHLTNKIPYRDFPEFFLSIMKSMGYLMIAGFRAGDKISFLYENYLIEIGPNNIRATIIENYHSTDLISPITMENSLVEKYKGESDNFQQYLFERITLLDLFIKNSFRNEQI
jgi:hypothetical protein